MNYLKRWGRIFLLVFFSIQGKFLSISIVKNSQHENHSFFFFLRSTEKNLVVFRVACSFRQTESINLLKLLVPSETFLKAGTFTKPDKSVFLFLSKSYFLDFLPLIGHLNIHHQYLPLNVLVIFVLYKLRPSANKKVTILNMI